MAGDRRRTQKEVRIADVARLAGVSTATVSRVLATPDKVTPLTHTLVMEAVRRSGYIPNSAARNLRTRRTMMVLAVVPNLANPVLAQILRGIDDELTRSGYGLVIGNLDNRREREARYVDLALSRQVDGVLLMNGHIPENGQRDMTEAGLPMVALCAAMPVEGIPHVVVEDREAAREAARHLTRLGHERLAYISGPAGHVIETERYAGFIEGLREAGLSERNCLRWEGVFGFSAGLTAAADFLRIDERPTAVFAACDESALGFIKAVRAAGVAVPGDVSVLGFDGIEFSDYSDPTLTTFRQPMHEIGRAGADILLRLIRKEQRPEGWNLRLPVELLERGTTGPAPRGKAHPTASLARTAGSAGEA
ncbi:LacI family DNA-binding transcriptional regulator [Arenibaculum pallidiluteum]|uniref:LacI family DNA-binding transcriptional regulator n=1 Tax=Arenibaculum pallidiluteum TaxID=2812559 RepID=UPI001A96AE55|nr:LacI family DNA-binding transcriptional regulator [Arenibaculum pallidiluteum]